MSQNNSRKLIHSPIQNIPIGEPIILPDGGHGLRISWQRKHSKETVTEDISLDKLNELVIRGVPKETA